MLGVNGGEFLVILVLAIALVGPARLPRYARALAAWIRRARSLLDMVKSQAASELGDEAASALAHFDPADLDPRRIVSKALVSPDDATPDGPDRPASRPTSTQAENDNPKEKR